jgi:alpha-amylase
VTDSFRALAASGCVEFLGETYYHSLSYLFDQEEFITQVRMHRRLMENTFGFWPITFRNTELIYQDGLTDLVWDEPGFKVILAEGAEQVLGSRSPLYAYQDYNHRLFLLLKSFSLSDDIAFRFSDRGWAEYPMNVDKFTDWVARLKLIDKGDRHLFLNLFMDYETFGEHQWAETGIFEFMKALPRAILSLPAVDFAWPSDVVDLINYRPVSLSVPTPISWADTERDLSAWMENDLQLNALAAYYDILGRIKGAGREDLLPVARRLSTSDHFYYMSTKYFQDGDVHKYFSPYASPEQAYIYYLNSLADLEERL